jgi:flagellar biosynthesis/type III secretory pathway protein FliH
MSNIHEMSTAEVEAYYLKARREFNALDRTKFTDNEIWGRERYLDELYFFVLEKKSQYEKGFKIGYAEGRKEAQALINSILNDLKSGNSIKEISEKHYISLFATKI